MSPEFKKSLWDELIDCRQFIGIDHNTLLSMPTYIRKIYILKHNDYVNSQKELIKQNKRKGKK